MKSILMHFSVFLLLISAVPLNAQEKKEENKFEQPVQEFPFSQPVYLQESKELQQTLTGNHFENNDGEMANTLSYEAEFGLTDWFQVSAGYSYAHHNVQNVPFDIGFLETAIAVGLFNNAKHAAALSFEAEFPLKKAEVEEVEAEDSPAYTPTLVYAFSFPKTQVHLNVGTEFQEDETSWFYNAAAVYGTGNLHPILELNAIQEEEFDWFVGAGLVVNGESPWELGTGIRRGVNNSDWEAVLHLVYEISLGAEQE